MVAMRVCDGLAVYLVAAAVGNAVPLPVVTGNLDTISFPLRYQHARPRRGGQRGAVRRADRQAEPPLRPLMVATVTQRY
jgi:hypothetical protein